MCSKLLTEFELQGLCRDLGSEYISVGMWVLVSEEEQHFSLSEAYVKHRESFFSHGYCFLG